ncbi:Low molecular weight protein-tyrosine-phosphatase Ptp [Paraburkholderia nemoris]|uniref:low molecular weight protein-tyrosine-phosphatase n=1 Tax=Paraburkholderia nemoris TaxID=2793076 RepID=UPI001912B7D7|nr:low molecular weight protein-tyrosine-phosphatase [Paraburkholderia nemoris]MBK5149466.1 low molecular weight phosphotyrosine protein phosphatase [Burkholderia sp. R-69608]CAE6902543.1 Low molecular weight protein-tyrosine-phosphatase Ptp [Paraburkholderia nemoris]
MIENILVVCEGNVCRSPMAAGLLADEVPFASVSSVGINAMLGHKAEPLAVELMNQRGISIGNHVATALNVNHIKSAQLVLTMSTSQRQWIEAQYAFSRGKVYRLGEHDSFDVADPYRRGRQAFEASLAQIERGLKIWIRLINSLAVTV